MGLASALVSPPVPIKRANMTRRMTVEKLPILTGIIRRNALLRHSPAVAGSGNTRNALLEKHQLHGPIVVFIPGTLGEEYIRA
jgi:hypothetical protein